MFGVGSEAKDMNMMSSYCDSVQSEEIFLLHQSQITRTKICFKSVEEVIAAMKEKILTIL